MYAVCVRRPLVMPPCCRVSALQQAVSQITGVPASEQIVMCDGAPLDPNRTLAAYKLPVVSGMAA